MEGNVKVHVESRTRLENVRELLTSIQGYRHAGAHPVGVAAAVSGPQR